MAKYLINGTLYRDTNVTKTLINGTLVREAEVFASQLIGIATESDSSLGITADAGPTVSATIGLATETDLAVGLGLGISSVSDTTPDHNASISLTLYNASNASGKTVRLYDEDDNLVGTVTPSSQSLTNVTFTIPDPKTFGTKQLGYLVNTRVEVVDAGATSSTTVQIQPGSGYAAGITEVTGIFADDTGVVVGDFAYGEFTSGTGSVTLATGSITPTGNATFRYWLRDDSDNTWGTSADEVFSTVYASISESFETDSALTITDSTASGVAAPISLVIETDTAFAIGDIVTLSGSGTSLGTSTAVANTTFTPGSNVVYEGSGTVSGTTTLSIDSTFTPGSSTTYQGSGTSEGESTSTATITATESTLTLNSNKLTFKRVNSYN